MNGKYRKHLLICVNQRKPDSPKGDCSRCGGPELRAHFTRLIQQHGLKAQVRASQTLCLDACELGPVVVVYPADIWYIGVTPADVEAIFAASILADEIYSPRAATEADWQKLRQLRQAERAARQQASEGRN